MVLGAAMETSRRELGSCQDWTDSEIFAGMSVAPTTAADSVRFGLQIVLLPVGVTMT